MSWLEKAEQLEEDIDINFISLWIALNAAYANDIEASIRPSEQELLGKFLERICSLDKEGKLYELVWQHYTSSIRVLLDTPYVFQPYWDNLNGKPTASDWQVQFENAKHKANKSLASKDTAKILSIVLNRIYTLRNQLIHGGATCNSSANRDQLRDSTKLLAAIVPIVIEVMMNAAQQTWGEPHYPLVKD